MKVLSMENNPGSCCETCKSECSPQVPSESEPVDFDITGEARQHALDNASEKLTEALGGLSKLLESKTVSEEMSQVLTCLNSACRSLQKQAADLDQLVRVLLNDLVNLIQTVYFDEVKASTQVAHINALHLALVDTGLTTDEKIKKILIEKVIPKLTQQQQPEQKKE